MMISLIVLLLFCTASYYFDSVLIDAYHFLHTYVTTDELFDAPRIFIVLG